MVVDLLCVLCAEQGRPQQQQSPYMLYPAPVLTAALELLTITLNAQGTCRDFVVANRGSVMLLLLPCFKSHDEVGVRYHCNPPPLATTPPPLAATPPPSPDSPLPPLHPPLCPPSFAHPPFFRCHCLSLM
jgi:hypothetical protein